MSTLSTRSIEQEELQKTIDQAIRKIQGTSENEVCRYLPGSSGGYMHHLTLKKMKHSDPQELRQMLRKFILDSDSPRLIEPKLRSPRGSRKRRDGSINFSRTDIERILELARQVGDKDLLARFSQKKPLSLLKKDLIRSIKNNIVCVDIWNAYVETIKSMQTNTELTNT